MIAIKFRHQTKECVRVQIDRVKTLHRWSRGSFASEEENKVFHTKAKT